MVFLISYGCVVFVGISNGIFDNKTVNWDEFVQMLRNRWISMVRGLWSS